MWPFLPESLRNGQAKSCKSCRIYIPPRKAAGRHEKIHASGGILDSQLIHRNEVDSEVDGMTKDLCCVQDRVDNGMLIITDVIAFLDCLLEEETEIQTVSLLDVAFSMYAIHCQQVLHGSSPVSLISIISSRKDL